MNPLDGATSGIDHRPKRCVSALVTIVADAIHITIGRYDKHGDHQKENQKFFHQKPPGMLGILGMLIPPPDSEDDPPLELPPPELCEPDEWPELVDPEPPVCPDPPPINPFITSAGEG